MVSYRARLDGRFVECGRRHAVPGRKAPRRDAGWRSVWRRAAPTTHFARVPRQRGDRTAYERLYWARGPGAIVSPSRAPWNKWGDPLAGGNRLCRERPLIGHQPRRERSRDGVGGNPHLPQPHADLVALWAVDCVLGGGGGSPACSVVSSADRHKEAQARRPAASPEGAAAGAAGCVSWTVAAALRSYRGRTRGCDRGASGLVTLNPEILILIDKLLFRRGKACGARVSANLGFGRKWANCLFCPQMVGVAELGRVYPNGAGGV